MKNILIVAVVFWLLFLNGYSQVKQFAGGASLGTAPQTIITGAQRAIAPVVQPPVVQRPVAPVVVPQVVSAPVGESVADLPTPIVSTATPEPAQPTAVVVVVQGLPEAAQLPTATPLPTIEPPRYPSAGQQWAIHEVTDKGYKQDAVFIYSANKLVRWAPGVHPSDADVRWTVGMVEAGNIAGEPIPQ